MKALLTDDSPIYRLGLKMALSGKFSVFEASSPAEAMTVLDKEEGIDIAILDISMEGDCDGLDLVAQIHATRPGTAIMVLSHHKKPAYIYKAIANGARAYLAKDSEPESILKAALDVCSGGCIFFGETIPPAALRDLFGENEGETRPSTLSPKELEVLEAVTRGLSNAEIASLQSISCNTVESYKERIKSKLGFASIVQCVAFAVSRGLVNVEE